MAENVDDLVLQQPRLIRRGLDAIDGKIDDRKVGQNSTVGVLMALGGYIRDIDVRVEHLEQRIGIPS